MANELPGIRDAFLSHRCVDKEFVRNLARDVEGEQFHGRQLLTWLDEAEIRPGQSIVKMVNEGLEMSRFIVLIMTPSYFSSESGWTDAEWHAALFADPDNRGGKVIPVLAEPCPRVPMLLRHLRIVDCTGNKYQQGLSEILLTLREEPLPRPVPFRGQMVESSGHISRSSIVAERAEINALPDVSAEHLYANLLPFRRLPEFVYVGKLADSHRTKGRAGEFKSITKTQARDIIHAEMERRGEAKWTPSFRILRDEVWTFHDLQEEEGPLAVLVNSHAVELIPTRELLTDEDERKTVTSLLNMALNRHLHRRGLVLDDTKDGRVYFPPDNGNARKIHWRPSVSRQVSRTVTKPFEKNGIHVGWLHAAAYIRVMSLASKFFIYIRPTWLLTSDGERPKAGPDVGRIVIRWTGRERDIHVLYHVRFWTAILRRNPGPYITISAGDQSIEVDGVPAHIEQAYGVQADRIKLMERLGEEAEIIAQEEEERIEVEISDDSEISSEVDELDLLSEEGDGEDEQEA